MTIYILRYVNQSTGQIKSLAFEGEAIARYYGNRAVLAGDFPAFTIESLNVITEVD